MEHIARQLEGVRRTGRWMLVSQRVSQWTAGVVAGALVLGLLDYALRMPGWLRLMMGVVAAAAAIAWLIGRVRQAIQFAPGLDQLALRLERMYPDLSGSLATAVDFSTHADHYRSPRHTADLVASSLAGTRDRLRDVDVRKLLNPSRTQRLALLMAGALFVLGAVIVAVPQHSAIAAKRWLAPLGDAQWPRRTQVEVAAADTVWPADMPLRFAATVHRGFDLGMRVTAHYRLIAPEGADRLPGASTTWQSHLMTLQSEAGDEDTGGHLFERQVELPESLVRSLERSGGEAAVEFYFEAGDDETRVIRMPLVARPAVTGLTVTVTPPAYALGLVGPQTVDLFGQSGQTPTMGALQGSTVELRPTLNKPSARFDPPLSLSFTLMETVEFPLRLVDEHGLTNLSERRYRIEAVQDQPPTVSLLQPAADEAVLPTASVPMEVTAQDDVAAEQVAIEARLERPPTAGDEERSQPVEPVTLASESGRAPQLQAQHTLELASLSVRPGDMVVLTGVARDIFNLDDRRHDPVRSAPRRLRVIDEAGLIEQLRTELAAVRQQAVRMERTQSELITDPPERSAPRQADLTRRLTGQREMVEGLISRSERNRLDEPAMQELMGQAAELLTQSQDASAAADQALQAMEAPDVSPEQADALREQAGAQQQRAADTLEALVALLDQGRGAMALQLQLRELQAGQANLAEEARRLFPQTAGQDAADLPQPLQDALQELARAQAAMAEQARDLAQQMQETAHALAQQPEDRAQAAAQALAEAAAIAQRQGLEQSMARSAEAVGQNQLSQAGAEQAASLDTLSQMLSEMGTQQDRMRAMLRRRLQALAQAIQRLIERQEGELTALAAAAGAEGEQAGRLEALERPQAALRQSTMAAQEQARTEAANSAGVEGEDAAQSVVVPLGDAVEAQGQAVLALREAQAGAAREAEAGALAALEVALQRVRAMEQEAAREQARQERAQLKAEYEALAARQDELREAVQPLAGVEAPSRRQRADLIDLGHGQADVQAAAAALGEQVGDTLIFQHLHRQVDQQAGAVAAALRTGRADAGSLHDQARIATMLRTMAAALDEDAEDEPFAGQQGEGGGGGEGSEPPLVPPAAELKLLRGLQETLYHQTRAMNETEVSDEAWLDLSARQRELAGLGERLIERVQRPE